MGAADISNGQDCQILLVKKAGTYLRMTDCLMEKRVAKNTGPLEMLASHDDDLLQRLCVFWFTS